MSNDDTKQVGNNKEGNKWLNKIPLISKSNNKTKSVDSKINNNTNNSISTWVSSISTSITPVKKANNENAENIENNKKTNSKTVDKKKSKYLSMIQEDLFGSKTVNNTEQVDIFNASVADVLLDMSKGAINLIKLPTNKPKPKVDKEIVIDTTNIPLSNTEIPFRNNRSVSDILEIDKNTTDSPVQSEYHIEKSIVLNDDGYMKKSNEIITNIPVFTKEEFLNNITDVPDDLLDKKTNEEVVAPFFEGDNDI